MARLGDVFELIRNGVSIKQTEGSGGIPITRIETISKHEIDRNKFGYAGISDASKYSSYMLQNKDILMSHINSEKHLGKAAIYKKIGDEQIIHGMNLLMLRADSEMIYPQYALYYFETESFRQQIMRITKRSVNQSSFTVTALKDLEIPLPTLKVQIHIATTLDKLTHLISLRKQQLAKLDELVKARFVEMFGDPEINPYGFEKHRLNDYCDLQNGYAFKSEDYVDKSEVLNCRMSNIRPDGSFSASYHPKYLPAEYWSKFSSYRLFDGDVIIAMTDMANDPKILGVPTIVSCAGKKMLLNQRVGKLLFRDTAEINRIYLMKALSHESVRAKLAKHSGGGLQINVGKPAILSSIILYPPMKFQNKFSEFSIDIDKRKLTIQKSLGTIEVLKKMLMQEYFG